jgi:oligoribonuclease NrnB/cAMP/cGMP phosphodiesterase (DHH superfamily)
MKKICIYHSRDLDGWMSGAIVKYAHSDIELLGWDYGNKIPNLSSYDWIILTDISFPKEIMFPLSSKIVWIDHHISAIKEMSGSEPLPFYKGLRNEKKAACELTWEYFFPKEKMPEIVRLLGRYDCFGHKGTDEEQKVLEFQYTARSVISNVEDATIYLNRSIKESLLEERMVEIGRASCRERVSVTV